jgi:hypothetical protein
MDFIEFRRFLYVLLITLFSTQSSWSTTIVCLVSSNGIFVGTDSKTTAVEDIKHPGRRVDKTAIVKHRIMVATVNLGAFDLWRYDSSKVFNYDFAKWIAGIEKKAPADIPVSSLTSLIESEASNTFDQLNWWLDRGAFDRQHPPDPLIEYVIAGYEAGNPTINRLDLCIDWNLRRVEPPVVAAVHPRHDDGIDKNLHVFGWNEVVNVIKDGKGDSYKEIAEMIPNELPKLVAGKDLSFSEARDACLALLRWEHNHHEALVGPPYVIIIIPPAGMGGVTQQTYPK